ncbi:hypothetical protein FOZ63_010278, partial [Perkinsus olseni]
CCYVLDTLIPLRPRLLNIASASEMLLCMSSITVRLSLLNIALDTLTASPSQHCLGLRDAVMSSILVRPPLLNIALDILTVSPPQHGLGRILKCSLSRFLLACID